MRLLIALMAISIACLGSASSLAMGISGKLTLSATVAPSCSIVVAGLMAHPETTARGVGSVCSPLNSRPQVPAPQPTTTFSHDADTGLPILIVEF